MLAGIVHLHLNLHQKLVKADKLSHNFMTNPSHHAETQEAVTLGLRMPSDICHLDSPYNSNKRQPEQTKRKFSVGKVSYYPNSCAAHNIRLIRAGTVETNPGDKHSHPGPHDSANLVNFAKTVFTDNHDIHIAHLNICSIQNKMDELKVLLQVCPFDIFAITESHLDRSVSNDEIEITNYTCLRKDRRKGKGGGCLVYYKTHLTVKRRIDLEDAEMETIWLQLKTKQSTDLLIGTVYRPPTDTHFFGKIIAPLEMAWAK